MKRFACLTLLVCLCASNLPPVFGKANVTRPPASDAVAPAEPTPSQSAPDEATRTQEAEEAFGKLPMAFEPNVGQTDPRVKFLSRGRGYSVYVTDTGVVLTLAGAYPGRDILAEGPADRSHAEPSEVPSDSGILEKVTDPAHWRTDVPTFNSVRYEHVYPGIDALCYGRQGQLEYDFVVSPGANPSAIELVGHLTRLWPLDSRAWSADRGARHRA